MQYRRLGRTGIDVSVLTLNTRGLDGRTCKDLNLVEASAAFALALEGGVNSVSTSPAFGEAETLTAAILKRERLGREVHVLSHVAPLLSMDMPSPHFYANDIFPGHHIRASTDASLKALKIERLALQQLPGWCAEWSQEGDWLETCHRLKEEGKIAGFGLAAFDHDPGALLDVLERNDPDCVQVMYNIFDPKAADAFSLCVQRGVSVVARSPLYAGAIAKGWAEVAMLTGDWRHEYFYSDHLDETRSRVAALDREVTLPDRTVADLALRFSLSHPVVSTATVGMRSRDHVALNLQAVERGLLSPDQISSLDKHKWLC